MNAFQLLGQCPNIGHNVLQKIAEYNEKFQMEESSELIDSILPNISISIEKHKDCGDVLYLALEKGIGFLNNDSIELALNIFHEIILHSDKKTHSKIQARVYIELGLLHEYIGRAEDSRRNLDLAHNIIIENSFDDIYPWYCVRYASYHRIFDNVDTAWVYAAKAAELGPKVGNDRASVDGLLLLGILSSEIEDKVNYFKQTLIIFDKNENYIAASSMCYNIVNILFGAKQMNKGLIFLTLMKEYLDKLEYKNNDYFRDYSLYYKMLTHYFQSNNQLDSALHYQALSYEFENKSTYKVDHNTINNKVSSFKDQLVAAQTKLKLLTQIIFVLLGFLIVGLGVALYYNDKKKNEILAQKVNIEKQNGELSVLNLKQAGLLTEVHHRMKNNLQLVISMLTLASHKKNIDGIEEFAEQMSEKVRSMALIHNQLYISGDYEKINLAEYLLLLRDNFLTYFNFEIKQVVINLHINTNINLNSETVMPIGLITTELLTNSLKHNKDNLVIEIEVEQVANNYILSYKDNGVGYNENNLKGLDNQFGLKLIQSLVKQLDGTAQFSNNIGAKFVMNFKEKKVSKV